MFPRGYFASSYFAPNYFPPVVAAEAVEDEGLDPNRFFVGGKVIHSVEDPRVKYVHALKGYFSRVREWPAYERGRDEDLENQVSKATSQASPEELQRLSDSIKALVDFLTEASGKKLEAKAIPPLVPMPPILIERIGDMIIERKAPSDDEDDEILLMMLLQ
jgi:hypothetical protein